MHFTGSVPPGDVPALLDRSRVLLSASGREGHPLSVLEALARGCTVLLSDIPAHRGFSGIHGVHLYPLRDEAAAAESLVHLVQEHVRVPRSWMMHDYSVEAHASKIERLYLEAIADRRLD
jgi:glycosyltransferase involved in cell wall biosynthesis